MFVWWGPERIVLHNDAYVASIGPRHPDHLGARAREAWAEVWDVLAPLADEVFVRARAVAHAAEAFLDANARRASISLEYRLRRRDGVYRRVLDQGDPRHDAAGRFLGYVGTVVDVTELRRVEAAHQESEALFRELANSIRQLAWTADETGWIFWHNRRWYDYTGTTLEEMQGWGWTRVHHPGPVDRVVRKIRAAFESGEPWVDTFPLRSHTGEWRWFLSRALPLRSADGRILRWFGSNTDITEDLRARDELAQALRARDEFLSIASHELKTPLTSLKTRAQLAKRELAAHGERDPSLLRLAKLPRRPTGRRCGSRASSTTGSTSPGSAPASSYHGDPAPKGRGRSAVPTRFARDDFALERPSGRSPWRRKSWPSTS